MDIEEGLLGTKGAETSYMSIEKVRERIVQWFMSESGDKGESQAAIDMFIADQFKNELNPNGMLSA